MMIYPDFLHNKGIIRNKSKINAIIYNAQVIISIQKKVRFFQRMAKDLNLKERKEWVKLFKKRLSSREEKLRMNF